MYAVGRLGSYITRGVSTVSGPFHPFGGAVDIVVVEQPDGSFKSSPWYVRFGKFQGVLKGKEKIVGISVNGVEADFHMYLDERGEAYFLREVEGGDAESGLSTSSSSSSSSSDETDGLCQEIKRPVKSKSCNFDAIGSKSIHLNDEKIVERTNSRRSRIFGLVFGRRSRKIDGLKDEDGDPGVERVDSLERAEIAADLLEMKWSTNLSSKNYRKDGASRFRASVGLDSKSNEVLQMNDRNGETEDLVKNDVLCGGIPSCSQARTIVNAEYGIATGGKGVQHVSISQEAFEISNVDGGVWEEKLELLSEVTRQYEGQNRGTAVHTVNEEIVISNFVCPVSVSSCPLDQELTKFDKLDVSPTNIELAEIGNLELNREADTVEYSANQMKSESFDVGLHPSTEQHREEVYLAAAEGGEVYFETVEVKTEIIPEVKKPVITAESFDQQAEVEYICGSTEEAAIQRMFTVSGLSEKDSLSDNEKSLQEDISSALKLNLEFTADTKNSDGDCLMPKATFTPSLEGSEEDKFPLTDLDGNSINEVAFVDEVSPDSVNTSSPFSLSTQCSEVAGLNYSHEKSCASSEMEDQENISTLSENSNGRSNITSNPIDVTESRDVDVDLTGACVSHEKSCASSHIKDQESSLIVPYYLKEKTNKIPSPINSTRSHDFYSLDLNDKSSDLFLASKESTNCMKSDTGKEEQLTQNQFNTECSQGLGGMPAAPFDPPVEVSLCRHLLYEGMGSDVASQAFEAEKLNIHKFSSIGPYVVKDERLVVRINGHYFPWEAGSPIVLGMVSFGSDHVFEMKGTIPIDKEKRTLQGDAPKATIPCDGSWRLWPFSMKKSKSRKTLRDLRSLDRANSMNEVKMTAKPKVVKRMVRSMTPTSEQLASLNLKEGSNLVTFTFSTSMLGKQQVDARIFLWKWNTRIIISDVDGTITKSDVLGQFMPLVGIDWSQTGVAPLYSAIKENGYQLLFLSARAISQAYHTRRFLFNINQDGKTLPDGPVVISPDGLFPSLYREVIRRAPHEFKIACLEEIRALFPPDHNPFYAGFGNRDTDEISYLKVGIPKGKIFIINPKGEVAVNRHVNTKSYTSLHALVNGMFPAMASFEQEDFNSWNFWKLPPPAIDV